MAAGRCSSCGNPIGNGAFNCSWCGASTLSSRRNDAFSKICYFAIVALISVVAFAAFYVVASDNTAACVESVDRYAPVIYGDSSYHANLYKQSCNYMSKILDDYFEDTMMYLICSGVFLLANTVAFIEIVRPRGGKFASENRGMDVKVVLIWIIRLFSLVIWGAMVFLSIPVIKDLITIIKMSQKL